MGIEKIDAVVCKEGHQYLIEYSAFDKNLITDNLFRTDLDVVNLVITNSNEFEGINNAHTLFKISQSIKEYLEENNVILYAYCDNKEIIRSKKNLKMLPQEFRSSLFSSMFNRKSNRLFINERIIISDPENGDHYIHLISREENRDQIEAIANMVKNQAK